MTTTTLFNELYSAFPISKEHLEAGNRIVMPLSALEKLTSVSKRVVYPMHFRITSYATGKHSHCGVVEFTADEGRVLMPTWMMKNMEIEEGGLVNLRKARLDKGTYIKIQPHATKFINLSNPKALLERAFRDFACLTAGETIEINHADKKYLIKVLETKPGGAISMTDTDCEVDFEQPLDYKEPEKKTSVVLGKRERTNSGDEDRKSRPTHGEESKLFLGEGRRTTTVNSMKKLKIAEVATTTKKVNGKPESKQGPVEFKPFSGKAKRLDGETIEINHVLETKPNRAISITDTDCKVDFEQPLDYKEPEKKTSVVLGKRERTNSGDEDRKSRPTHGEESKLFPSEGRRLGGTTTVNSMKKLKIAEVATKTKKVDGKPESKQGPVEFKPFSGKAKRLDGEPVVAKVATDVEHDQPNARANVNKEEHQGFKAFTGKSFRPTYSTY